MSEINKEIRHVVRDLILEGLEVSVTCVQDALKEKGMVVQNKQVAIVIKEEGGLFPEYQGLMC